MPDTDKARVLLVDDQPARLLSYEAILGGMDVTLVRANSGEDALRALMGGEYAVILLDVNMPGMDGFETASMIHQHPRFEKTPIIFVTGVHVTDLDRLRGYKLGAFDYVYIPVVPEILRSKVAVLVELYNHRRELQHLNRSLERANEELAAANVLLEAEKTRELQALNATLEQANAELASTNLTLKAESLERGLAEARMRFLADTIPSIVWTCDPQGAITYANRNWHEYYGVPAAGVPATITQLVLYPEESEPVRELVERSLALGENFEFEARHRGHDGRYSWFITRAVPWRDADGRVGSWFGISTNINDQKELMERLRESDRRKDEFLAILGHELRNPLAPIRNAVQIMRLRGLPDPQLAGLRDMIDRQVEQLTRLVDDLLDVSRITRGKIELKRMPLTVAEVLARAIESSRPLIDERRIELALTLPDEPLPLEGDMTRLAQVFGNLLNNAAKYSREGSRIEVLAERVGGQQAQVRVRDHGVGIPADMLDGIFDPFTQVESTRRHAQGGLGIGLALVKRLVEMHGGSVVAYSEGLDRGSEFCVSLRLNEVEAPARADVTLLHPAAATRHRRIVIADDNHDAAQSLAQMLRLAGHEVFVAGDGAEAVRLAAEVRPDAALLDIGMPKLDGYETARRLRAEPWGRNILLIALTGWGQLEDRRRTLAADFNAHCVKPVAHQELEALLNQGTKQPATPLSMTA
jgi:PAS domain S-box-containing protein